VTERHRAVPFAFLAGVLLALTAAVALFSLAIGRFPVPVERVARILLSALFSTEASCPPQETSVVLLIRLPRVLGSLLAGGGLALAGAALQGVFRNPLVGPQIIGVSSGAGFGGAVAILFFDSLFAVIPLAFVFGLLAMVAVWRLGSGEREESLLSLVLGGVVISAFFTALTSLGQYVADPYNKLPAIVMWLMGSFASSSWERLFFAAPVICCAGTLLHLIRFRINVLSLGQEEAESLGMNVHRNRWLVLTCTTLITAATVALAGIVGWVGLIVPHMARMLVGSDHRKLLPVSALLGASYLILMDDIARSLTAAEIPIGILTALAGAPLFAFLLKKRQRKGGAWM